MEIRILGCSGGIGGPGRRTTSLLVDADILIDCGTGLGELSADALVCIDHVFLTHSHLDHVALLPMLIDSVADRRDAPLIVHALPETISALRQHVFNWTMWPDFTCLPSAEAPRLRFVPLAIGEQLDVAGRTIRVLPARHAVPAVGYCLEGTGGAFAFTGDTSFCQELIEALNGQEGLRYLVVETAFPEAMRDKARSSQHLYPGGLGELLGALRVEPEVFVTHLKPCCELTATEDIARLDLSPPPRMLENGQLFVI